MMPSNYTNNSVFDLNRLSELADLVLATTDFKARQSLAARFEVSVLHLPTLSLLLQSLRMHPNSNLVYLACECLTRAVLQQRLFSLEVYNTLKQQQNSSATTEILKDYEQVQKNTYSTLVEGIYLLILREDLKPYAANTAINLMSVSLKRLLECLCDADKFSQLLSKFFFPQFSINHDFVSAGSSLPLEVPGNVVFGNRIHFVKGMRVLSSLLDYITMLPYFKTYFEFRRNLYSFRNTYLAVLLQLCVLYIKLLGRLVLEQQQPYVQELGLTLKLTEAVTTYPVTPTMNEYDYDEDAREVTSSQIFFPSYYHSVTSDQGFLRGLFALYCYYSKNVRLTLTSNQDQNYDLPDELFSLLRIQSRLFAANSYYFSDEQQRRRFRSTACGLSELIVRDYRYCNQNYTNSILQMAQRMIQCYSSRDMESNFQTLVQAILDMTHTVVQTVKISLQDLQSNSVTKAFSLLKTVYDQIKSGFVLQYMGPDSEAIIQEINRKIQSVLEKFMLRISNPAEARNILGDFKPKDFMQQIQAHQELFKPLPQIFDINPDQNVRLLQNLNLLSLDPASQVLWIHLCAELLLPCKEQNITPDKALLILKMFDFVKDQNRVADLRYLQVMLGLLLNKIENGKIGGKLWDYLAPVLKGTADQFVVFVVRKCATSMAVSQQLIEYSLEILTCLYTRLKRSNVDNFKQYSAILQELLIKVNQTLFNSPDLFKKRIRLYQMISLIWIEDNDSTMIYEIYWQVRKGLTGQYQELLRYLYDVTGMLKKLENHGEYKVVAELVLQDFDGVLKQLYFGAQTYQNLFKQQLIRKAFLKMADSLVSDCGRRLTFETHSNLPLLINKHLTPLIHEIAQKYPYGKRLITVLNKMVGLCPSQPAIPLPPKSNCDDPSLESLYGGLISNYFDHIYKVEDLNSLYQHLKDNVDHMMIWYEQAIDRQLELNIEGLKNAVQGRVWKSKKQKETLARILWMVGAYRKEYMIFQQLYEGASEQKQFIQTFDQLFKI